MEELDEKRLLLIDIDGVIALETQPPFLQSHEILRLHENLNTVLSTLGMPSVILTHRSRHEVKHILEGIGLDDTRLAGIIAAEDILFAAARSLRLPSLLRGGLLKSMTLPIIERKYSVNRSHIAFIDDKLSNLRDLLAYGLGLAILAPSSVEQPDRLISFDFADVASLLSKWEPQRQPGALVGLPPRTTIVQDWHRTGKNTLGREKHPFNRLRRLGRIIRSGI